jgi:hypothetical protein
LPIKPGHQLATEAAAARKASCRGGRINKATAITGLGPVEGGATWQHHHVTALSAAPRGATSPGTRACHDGAHDAEGLLVRVCRSDNGPRQGLVVAGCSITPAKEIRLGDV